MNLDEIKNKLKSDSYDFLRNDENLGIILFCLVMY